MNENESVAFLEAVTRGDAATVSALIAANPDLVRVVGDRDKTALHRAADPALEVARLPVDGVRRIGH